MAMVEVTYLSGEAGEEKGLWRYAGDSRVVPSPSAGGEPRYTELGPSAAGTQYLFAVATAQPLPDPGRLEDALRKNPGCTSRELSEILGVLAEVHVGRINKVD